MPVRLEAFALLTAIGLLWASGADAQGPASRLAAPSESGLAASPGTDRPDPTGPSSDAEGEVAVPPPPGSTYDEESVRYPVPTRRATERPEDEPDIRISSRTTTRLRALDANLHSLAARGGGNVVNAVLSLLTGGLSITLGALKEPNDDWMSIYLYVYGGTAAARGILDLVLSPNASGPAVTYQHMPMTNEEEVEARLRYGENALRSLAEQSLIARILDASLNMVAGVAVVPIYLAPNEFEIGDPLDYFILIGAGVSIVSGIITLASSSAAEQHWAAYQELRDRLEEEREAEDRAGSEDEPADLLTSLDGHAGGPRWTFGMSPTHLGGIAGLGLQF